MAESFDVTVTAVDVDRFAAVSGDISPLHMDDAFDRDCGFPGRVAHGALPGGLLQSMNLQFKSPVGAALGRVDVQHMAATQSGFSGQAQAPGGHRYRITYAITSGRRQRMLGLEWLPTPLEEVHERRRIEIRPPAPPPRWALGRTLRVFAGYNLTTLRHKLAGRNDPDDRAVRLRLAFEDLGGLWIKIGQLLSLRTDVFSAEVCRELSQLQHRAVGFPFEDVRRIVANELGVEIGEVFSEFDPEPLAAASLSQVHLARLRGGNVQVAVKIRRPEAEATFRRDLRHLGGFIAFVNLLGLAPHAHLEDAVYELELMVCEELDFRYEAANTRRMRKSLEDHGIYAPRVFEALCSANVLVTEYVGGVLMSDYIRLQNADPGRVARWRSDNNFDARKVGTRLLISIMRQLLEDNLFHGDIHPGNILLLRDSRFAFIDFGVIGSCETEFLANYKASLAAMAQKDFAKAADITMRFAIAPPALGRLKELRKEMVRSYRAWEARSHLRGMSYHERSLWNAGIESGQIMARYKVQLSWEFMRISRTWGTLDASLNYLLPEANYMALFKKYFRDHQRRNGTPQRTLVAVAARFHDAAQTIDEIKATLLPGLRRQALVGAAIGSFSEEALRVVAMLFRFARTLVLFTVGLGGLAFLDIYYTWLLPFDNHVWLDHLAADIDKLSYEWWIVTLAGLTMMVGAINKGLKRLERRE